MQFLKMSVIFTELYVVYQHSLTLHRLRPVGISHLHQLPGNQHNFLRDEDKDMQGAWSLFHISVLRMVARLAAISLSVVGGIMTSDTWNPLVMRLGSLTTGVTSGYWLLEAI